MVDISLITNEPLNYFVYIHKNIITEKVYVGITNNPNRRWHESGYKHCPDFYEAIQEFGWSNFEHIIVAENLPKSMASIMEYELIKKYDLRNNGYNSSSGSWKCGSSSYKPIYQYNIDGSFIKEWPDRSKAICLYGNSIVYCAEGKCRTAYKYRWDFKKKKKLSPLPKLTKTPKDPSTININDERYVQSSKVYKFNLNGDLLKIYDNLSKIDDNGARIDLIYKLCEKQNCYAYNEFVWVYEEDAYTGYVQKVIDKHNKKHPKYVQYDLDGNLIKIYNTINELELSGFNIRNINSACKGIMKTCENYQWRYGFDAPPGKIISTKYNKVIPIAQKTLDGEIVAIYKSAAAAAKKFNSINGGCHILEVCKGKRPIAFNYLWEYSTREEYENYIATKNNYKNQEVMQNGVLD